MQVEAEAAQRNAEHIEEQQKNKLSPRMTSSEFCSEFRVRPFAGLCPTVVLDASELGPCAACPPLFAGEEGAKGAKIGFLKKLGVENWLFGKMNFVP